MEDSYTKRYKIALYLICRNHIISRNQIDGIVKIPSDDIDVTALDVMTSITRMSSTRQKINLCKSRNPRLSNRLIVWDLHFCCY